MFELYECIKCGVTTIAADGHCSNCGRKARRVDIITSAASSETNYVKAIVLRQSATDETRVINPVVVTCVII